MAASRSSKSRSPIRRWVRIGFLVWAAVSTTWLVGTFRTRGVATVEMIESTKHLLPRESQGTETAVTTGEPQGLPCFYVAAATAEDPAPEMEAHPGCAVLDEDGRPEISPDHLAAAHYVDGLASMFIDGAWYYVRSDGLSVRVLTYDNGPDPWSEGLVRSRRNGKIVYLNQELEVVIPPRYDWGWPFEDGRALVCLGCRLAEPEGEHRPVVGGTWGYIDTSGKEVVAVRFTRDEALELSEPDRRRR